jgi:leucyl/phenylalanyl-tRNA--protein transferase
MLTPDLMLAGYADGVFPMAESRDAETLHWVDPRRRGIFPLPNFHISRSLEREIRAENYRIRTNSAFSKVVAACAERDETWINAPLSRLYAALHATGHAHSVEVWQDGELTGGVFGLTLGAAFFGESMFSRRRDASKLALAYLVDRLNAAGFRLFDTQFLTPHLASLGAIEISRGDYRKRLAAALQQEADFTAPQTPTPQLLLQRNSQTS